MIVLVCGASGTGKSRLSYPLAARLGVPLVEVDDIVEALKAVTTPEQLPALHYWDAHPEAVHLPPEEIVELQIAVARALVPAVEAVVGNHLSTSTPVVIEGDYLLPVVRRGVRSIVLHEADEEQLVANYRAREPEEGEQRGRARVSLLYGDWLAERGRLAGAPVVPARPWSDVLDRVAEELRRSSPPPAPEHRPPSRS
ncbi:hypothetical protein [Nonomuraea soli]|uniref:2-phosphoglycerate kinase n=1 Tax=Nonomuraea soli TaxID=1032476 RepID=A0A7W0CLJ5_9ACTN|nr:hypothetical protein [Nonomuraea soli]MBA2893326.1 2-phosphoglycerate kinase [Nonomuraea soli]